jgi:hypothetical protein
MRRESKSPCAGRLALALVIALAAILTPAPPPAGAQTYEDPGSPPEATEAMWGESGATDGEIERWWGAVGAAICGAEIRLITRAPAIGMNPYALAAGIAGCGIALLDIVTT